MRRRLAAIFAALNAWLLPLAVRAQDSAPSANTIKGKLGNTGVAAGYDTAQKEQGIYNVVSAVINGALDLLGVIFLVLIVYGGYIWMTAGGDESKVEKARSTITRATIGLVIVLLSLAIANFVIPRVVCWSNPANPSCSSQMGPDDVYRP